MRSAAPLTASRRGKTAPKRGKARGKPAPSRQTPRSSPLDAVSAPPRDRRRGPGMRRCRLRLRGRCVGGTARAFELASSARSEIVGLGRGPTISRSLSSYVRPLIALLLAALPVVIRGLARLSRAGGRRLYARYAFVSRVLGHANMTITLGLTRTSSSGRKHADRTRSGWRRRSEVFFEIDRRRVTSRRFRI